MVLYFLFFSGFFLFFLLLKLFCSCLCLLKTKEKEIYPLNPDDLKKKIIKFCPQKTIIPTNKNNDLYLIIGSGIGSLATAACLARLNYSVLIVEQHHSVLGGNLHTFIRKKKEKSWKFEVGLHYIGKLDKWTTKFTNFLFGAQQANRLWRKLSDPFDKIIFSSRDTYLNTTFSFRDGYLQFEKDLQKICSSVIGTSPSSSTTTRPAELIHEILNDIKKASDWKIGYILKFFPMFWATILYQIYLYICEKTQKIGKGCGWGRGLNVMDQTFGDYLRSKGLKKNDLLFKVLTSQFANYGSSIESTPFGFASSVIHHYISNGAYYPDGGIDHFVNQLLSIILECGGKIWTRAFVNEICFDSNENIIGVSISLPPTTIKRTTRIKSKCTAGAQNSVFVSCSRIICGTNLNVFCERLLPKQIKNKYFSILSEKLQTELKSDVEFIFCFIGLKQNQSLPQYNIWHIPDQNQNQDSDSIPNWEKEEEQDFPVFIASGSAKENFLSLGNTLVAICFGKYEWFIHLSSDEYTKQKERIEKKLLNIVTYYLPEIKKNIEYCCIGTPLTYQKYLATFHGEAYGMAMNIHRYKNMHLFHPETRIKNLFLCGQDIMTLGITGALMSSFACLVRIHGYKFFLKILLN